MATNRAMRFRLALIRDARFPAIVNDIVVEFGTARYQDVIDRFVRGDAVDDGTLCRIWQDTTQPTTAWDLPIYEEFFRVCGPSMHRWRASGRFGCCWAIRLLIGAACSGLRISRGSRGTWPAIAIQPMSSGVKSSRRTGEPW